GKIRHAGVSNVSEEQLRAAERVTPIVSIQNRYNASDRKSEPLVDLCEQVQLAFLPWAPIQDAEGNRAVREAAARHGLSERQVMLAWLLARSPQNLPIPGSGSAEHVESNIASYAVEVAPDEVAALTKGGGGRPAPALPGHACGPRLRQARSPHASR